MISVNSERRNWRQPERRWHGQVSEGREDQDTRLPGSGGALASRPRAKIHPKRHQGPDDDRIWRKPRGGRGRYTEAQRDPRRANPPGADRDLGAFRRRQRGGAHRCGNGGRLRHAARKQGQSAKAGGQRVRATPRWAALRTRRVCREQAKQEILDKERLRMGRRQEIEGNKDPETVEEKGGEEELDQNVMLSAIAQVRSGQCPRLEYHHLMIWTNLTHW